MLAIFDRLLDFLSPKIEVETLHTGKTTLHSNVLPCLLCCNSPEQCDYNTVGRKAQNKLGTI